MARMLFFTVPAYGHTNPALPVLRELGRRGQQVTCYSGSTFRERVEAAGVDFRAYPESQSFEREMAARAGNLADVSVLMLEQSLRLLPFVLSEIDAQRPDLVLFDSLALWGRLAARLRSIPSVASITTFVHEGVPGLMGWRDLLYVLRSSLTRVPTIRALRRQLITRYGAHALDGPLFPCKGDLNIVYTSREFQADTPFIDERFHFVGPSILPSTRAASDFPWDALEPGRPTIYISLGTIYNRNRSFYQAVFAAFADHPAQCVLSVGSQLPIAELGAIPANFIVRQHVPQLELLQQVQLFITHGGMNSVSEGLSYGMPLVVVPQQIEQAFNGRQVARQQAGVLLADRPPYGAVDAPALRSAADRVLADPAYRQHAQRLRDSFHAAGGYQRAAALILSLLPPR